MKVAVIGAGYVGLITGVCFADLGNNVICIDKDKEKLSLLKQHKAPFYEPGLAERLEKTSLAGRLSFSQDIETAILNSEIIFIAVDTPQSKDGSADVSAVMNVIENIFTILKNKKSFDFKVIVNKSTVPVGTGQKVLDIRNKLGFSDDQIAVLSNPEFLREGTSIYDFFHPDRIVLGSSSEKALNLLTELYDPLYRNETPIVKTNLQTAELAKYASNAFLATKISFINEMANLCELTGSDVKDLSKIMGMDGRIGRYFLHPGPGYGGSCFPKDTQALIHSSKELNYDLKIVKAVEDVNQRQKTRIIYNMKNVFGSLKGLSISLLGLAFKPNTDDVRAASSIEIIKALLNEGVKLRVFDPEVKLLQEFSNKDIVYAKDSYDAAAGVDALVLVTEWNLFRELDLEKIRLVMKQPYFFDLRNVYDPQKLEQAGFNAYVIGRKVLKKKIHKKI